MMQWSMTNDPPGGIAGSISMDAAAAAIGLTIPAEYRSAVQEDLNRLAAIASFLTQFPLGQEIEAAPVFQP
jgi:hypothetical protein